MGRTSTITHQQLLDAGLNIIIRQGYSAVTIKSVAQALGCSTQPIVWLFGNVENYRTQLRRHATAYAQSKTQGQSAAESHSRAGYAYIDMAIDEPNLIRYLRSDEKDLRSCGGIALIFDEEASSQRREFWQNALGVSREEADKFLQFCVVYTEGIVSMILSGVLPPDRENAHRLLQEGSAAYIIYLKEGDRHGNRNSN